MRRIFPAILACLLLGALPAAADTWYVSATTGSIGGSGTIDDPFLYIQQGLDAAAASGDVVLILPGTYSGAGNRDLATLGKAVTVRGQLGAAVTIIDVGSSAHDGFFLDDTGEDQGTRIESLTIRGARYGIRMDLGGTAPVLEDLALEANSTAGLRYQTLSSSLGALDIIGCVFRDHPGDAVHLDIVTVKNAGRRDPFAILDDCTFLNNGTGIHCDRPLDPTCRVADSGFTGNDLATWGSVELLRCTVADGDVGCAGETEGLPHHIVAADCTFTGITDRVFGQPKELLATGCTIDANPGDIHRGGPIEESYQSLQFVDCDLTDNSGALELTGGQATLVMTGCLYAGNNGPVRFGNSYGFGSLTVDGCTLALNAGDALEVTAASGGASITGTIIAANGGRGIDWQYGTATWTVTCCDVWDNAGGDYVGLPEQTGLDQNISLDPRFCDPAADDLSLRADSPCLPGVTGCGLMGARDQGCTVPTTWFVATWGSDENGDGSFASPFRTVQLGLDTAAAGDTVVVDDGVYPEALEITRGVLLRSASNVASQCVLAGIADHRVLTIHTATDTVRLQGVEISGGRPRQNDYDGLNPGGGVLVHGPPLVMTGCNVLDNATPLDETAIGGGGIHARDGSYLRLVGCRIGDNVSYRAGGVLHRSDEAMEMYACIVHHNHSERQAGGVWILPDGGTSATIARTTIVENTATINGGGIEAYLTDLTLDHAIVAFNTGGTSQVRLRDCTGAIDCNDLFDPDGGPVFDAIPGLPRPSDIGADPWFCRKSRADYSLLDISPCAVGPCGQIGALGTSCTYTGSPDPLPGVAVLHPARPNPFNARVELTFTLARPGPVRLDVVDLRGAVVATVAAGGFPRGKSTATWDGRDGEGRPVAAGVYLVRLQTGDGRQTERVALVK